MTLHADERPPAGALSRNHVKAVGTPGARPLVLLHGFGADQDVWWGVVPALDEHNVILLDLVGAGSADASRHDLTRYADLHGHAEDVADVLEELDLRDAVLVGHSVSAMIAVLTAELVSDRIGGLVLLGPSPRYIDDGAYVGGFSHEDIDDLLETMREDFLGWSSVMAPAIMGNADRPALGRELADSFSRTDPELARQFAAATFRSDHRDRLGAVRAPTLVVQTSGDIISPEVVGRYVHEHIPGSAFLQLEARGHCPHLSAPDATAAAILDFVGRLG